MDGMADELLIHAARQLHGGQRRMFLAKVRNVLCDGSARKSEEDTDAIFDNVHAAGWQS